jgi:hypothetical protein
MQDRALRLLEDAQRRLIASLAVVRPKDEQALLTAQRAFSSVLPHLPGLIDSKVTDADACILTREQFRAILAQFALDLLTIQTAEIKSQLGK